MPGKLLHSWACYLPICTAVHHHFSIVKAHVLALLSMQRKQNTLEVAYAGLAAKLCETGHLLFLAFIMLQNINFFIINCTFLLPGETAEMYERQSTCFSFSYSFNITSPLLLVSG